MTVTLHLRPEIEEELSAQAREHGLSLDDYLPEVVAQAAGLSGTESQPSKGENLSDLLLRSPFVGADLNLERCDDYPRSIELE